jgi:hypothetical protein
LTKMFSKRFSKRFCKRFKMYKHDASHSSG